MLFKYNIHKEFLNMDPPKFNNFGKFKKKLIYINILKKLLFLLDI